jgi:hypothetical protein
LKIICWTFRYILSHLSMKWNFNYEMILKLQKFNEQISIMNKKFWLNFKKMIQNQKIKRNKCFMKIK